MHDACGRGESWDSLVGIFVCYPLGENSFGNITRATTRSVQQQYPGGLDIEESAFQMQYGIH